MITIMSNAVLPSPTLRVNMISETTFTVRGHGVHTAFKEMTSGLMAHPNVDVKVNTFRPADITHIQTIGGYSLLHLWFGSGKKVISVHVIPDSFTGSLRGAKYWYGLSAWYLRQFYGRADRLLAVSEEVKDTLIKQLRITKPIDVVYNTIDAAQYHTSSTDHQAARHSLNIPDDTFVVAGNGQIQPRKRFDIFLKLARDLPHFRFFWIGGIPFKHLGADFAAMQAMIAAAPANLTVTGVIELAQVRRYFQAADAFILPSNQENHPLAVLEAAASGLPIVVRDIKEYDSAFHNDVLRGNDSSFKSILIKLHRDPKYRADSIAKAKLIAARFDNVAGSQRLIELYNLSLGRSWKLAFLANATSLKPTASSTPSTPFARN